MPTLAVNLPMRYNKITRLNKNRKNQTAAAIKTEIDKIIYNLHDLTKKTN